MVLAGACTTDSNCIVDGHYAIQPDDVSCVGGIGLEVRDGESTLFTEDQCDMGADCSNEYLRRPLHINGCTVRFELVALRTGDLEIDGEFQVSPETLVGTGTVDVVNNVTSEECSANIMVSHRP